MKTKSYPIPVILSTFTVIFFIAGIFFMGTSQTTNFDTECKA